MWKRLAAAGMAALLVIAAFWMAWPRTLNAEQVLARAAQTTAAEPGQIIYQVYSSGGSLYREWQRLQTAPDGTLLSVEVLTIRYAKHDTAFEAPLEWIFSGPDRMCRWPLENTMSAPTDNRDAEGCRVVAASPETTTETSVFAESSAPGYEFTEAADPALRDQIQETLREASDAPGTVEVATIKTIQDQIESLQAASGTVTVVQMQLENRPVYAIEDTQLTSDSAGGSVLRTLYVDQKTFLPAGLSYQAQRSDGEIITWSALVMDYRVLNAAELDFDPFIWPPTQTP